MATEQEYKWQVRGKMGLLAFKKTILSLDFKKETSKLFIFDSYFDDAARTLGAAKTALRLRSTDGEYEITVKKASDITDGLASRNEETYTLSQKSHTRAMKQLKYFFRTYWPELDAPKQIFIIKNHRESILLSSKTLTAEISLDDCNILVGEKNIKMYEAELEFKDGSFDEFQELAKYITEQTGCPYATVSKVATAVKNL